MSKGCVTFIEKGERWLYQIDTGKTPDGKRIRESMSYTTKENAQTALDIRLAALGESKDIENTLAHLLNAQKLTDA